jgi:quercetin 2,3-dioxygenase
MCGATSSFRVGKLRRANTLDGGAELYDGYSPTRHCEYQIQPIYVGLSHRDEFLPLAGGRRGTDQSDADPKALDMSEFKPMFVREVSSIGSPEFEPGHAAGQKARRLIDAADSAQTDPFLIMAEDWTPRGAFPFHPHRGIETVTFVIEGALEHRDSAGYGGVIHAGDAQWMTAGRGIQHEENPPPGTIAHTLQLWVNLPAVAKLTEPRYQDLIEGAMPVRKEPGVQVRVYSGKSGDAISQTLNHVPVTMLEVRLEPGASLREQLPANENAFIYILEGAVRIGEMETPVEASELAWLTRSEGSGLSELELIARNAAVRLLLFSARPLNEPIAFGGPFVMNTPAEVAEAFADFRAGKF